ncbi:MAG: serine/threonine-protein kinase [Planctomycetota bacterium]
MASAKQVGDRVGPYRLTSVLGEGGAGQVFRAAWDPPAGEEGDAYRDQAPADMPGEVAIKLLRSAHAGSEAIFHRFVREIGVAQRIHHPHIVRHLDSGLADGFLYYAMELVPYGSLREVIQKRGALPWRDAVESAVHVADGLACLHDAGVVHRDLKPDNVFLSETGGLKLGDFGLATTDDSPQLTMAGQTVGSVRYMAPEQVKGERDLDGRCDLYALGCLIFEMCSGRPPFESTDPMVVFYKHVEEPPPKLRSRAPGVPASLEELVARLLEKDKQDRPPSGHGVRAALAAIHAAGSSAGEGEGDGEIANLDELLAGDVADIEAEPEDPDAVDGDDDDDSEATLAGLGGSQTLGDLTGGSLSGDGSTSGSDAFDPNAFDRDEYENDRKEAAAAQEDRSDLSQRLAEGAPAASTANPAVLIGVVAAVLIGGAIALFASGGGPNETGIEEPPAEAAP